MESTDITGNSDRSLRILLLGDASNYHRALAEGLRRRGHYVAVASDGGAWMDTERDIDLKRRSPGKLGGLQLWLMINRIKKEKLTGYDIVSIIGPGFAVLRPPRLHAIFDYVRKHNRHVFFNFVGTNSQYIETTLGPDSPLRYDEWQINGMPSPLALANPDAIKLTQSPPLYNYCLDLFNRTDGTVTALYEYHVTSKLILPDNKLAYAGIPVDTRNTEYTGVNPTGRKVKLFLGRYSARQLEKGTDKLMTLAKKVVELHPDRCELQLVENVSYIEYLQLLQGADIVLDQVYSYTPATNALLAMAMGKTVVSGGEPEFYDFIGEYDNRPIINAVPDDDDALFRSIEEAVMNPQRLIDNAPKNRDFVIKHNDTEVVTNRFLNFWASRI